MENNIDVLKESLKDQSLVRQLSSEGMLIHIAKYHVNNAKAILSWSQKNNTVLSENDINKIERHIKGCEAYDQAQPYSIL
ncbi:MAG: hypothetical protein GY821_17005 [Gammaproteobacteria bacterium]|nr:hypothetical protein [Gammaproteobacteria bacterium]